MVAESGSFSAAGRVLELSPSAVSRAVDRIEERLGVRLLLRSTRSLILTAEGQSYLLIARRILSDLDDSEQQLANQGAPRGRLRVSAALAYGRRCLPPILSEFTELYPQILIDLTLSDALSDIAGGQADVAIRFGNLKDTSLSATRLGESRRVVVASPEYLELEGSPHVPEDLLVHNCLNFSLRRSEEGWPFRINDSVSHLAIRGNTEADSGETLSLLALHGVGIARVAEICISDEIKSGRLVPLLEDFNPEDTELIHAVYLGGVNMPARVRVFIDFLDKKLNLSQPG